MNQHHINIFYTGFASLMASNGLISNSMTGIIGSMLVSPYSNTIIQIGSGLEENRLDTTAITHLIIYMTMSIAIGFMYYKLYSNIEHDEDLSVSFHDNEQLESMTYGRYGTYLSTTIYAIFVGSVIRFMMKTGHNISANIGCAIGISLLPAMAKTGIYLAKCNYEKSYNSCRVTLFNILGFLIGFYSIGKLAESHILSN